MNNYALVEDRSFARFSRVCGLLSALALSAVFFTSQPSSAQEPEKEGMGIIISSKASAENVGLPLYAGSKPHKDNSDDSAAARLGLWGGGSGFKLAVLKMQTTDSPEKVAAFYKSALAKYGKVLDCSNPPPDSAPSKNDDVLTCGGDKPEKGSMLFKSGTKEKQHLVGIQANGQGTIYQLVALGNWKNPDKN